jgi:hypothetical protein
LDLFIRKHFSWSIWLNTFAQGNPFHNSMHSSSSLEDLLLPGTGRDHAEMLVDAALQNRDFFTSLVKVYLSNAEPHSRKAAWAIDLCVEKEPELISSWTGEMIRMLEKFSHDGLKRHTLRMLMHVPLPEEDLGTLVKICFEWLVTASESVAVKVYSMELLYRVSQQEPDLKKELADSIEWRLEEENAGFRNKGLKILKKLSREIG